MLPAEHILDSYVGKPTKAVIPSEPAALRVYLLELIEHAQQATLEHRRQQVRAIGARQIRQPA